MHSSRRRFLAGLGAVLVAPTVFAACGSPAPPTAAPAATKPAEQAKPADAPKPTGAPAAGAPAAKTGGGIDLGAYTGPSLTNQPVKIRLMRQVYPPATDQWWKARYAEFTEAYPNITFQEEQVPYGDLNTKLQTYVAAGDAPEIMMGKGDFVQSYAFNKIALNLSDYTNPSFVQDLTPTAKAQQLVQGKLYASAWEQSQIMLYFNKDLFEKAGATPPPENDATKPWNWEQFLEACDKLVSGLNKGGEITTYALAASAYGNGGPGSSYWYEGMYVRSQGDPGAAKDSTAYKTFAGVSEDGATASGYVDTPEAVAGMKVYQTLFTKKYTPTVAVPNMWEDGKAVMRFGSIGTIARVKSGELKLPFKMGAAAPPKGKMLFNHTSGDSPIVFAKTKFPAETVAFINFLTSDANRISWHKTWGMTPSRVSLFDKMNYTDPGEKLASELTRIGYAPPVTAGYLEYFSAINAAVKDIALGAAPEERLKKAAKDIDGFLAPYKK
jgi:multiple sugar transport system substrate-binding protein